MSIPPALKDALRELRRVRAMRPDESADPVGFAYWRLDMADCLDELARHVLYDADRERAAVEAAEARRVAARTLEAHGHRSVIRENLA
ncbi:hypothetical protein ABZ801_22730 [Actinomadura sp. NPDC047616]|uniref:hypothetical protein n=1 Tax=Actinomadura sp. NPDC047616 TaxID=3155914 RepID=UPI0033CDB31E